MTTTLTASDAWSETATAPADGDTRNAASVNTPLQTILNNTKHVYERSYAFLVDHYFDGATNPTTSSTSYVTATGYSISLGTLQVGDVVQMHALVGHYIDNAAYTSTITLMLSEDSGATTSTANITGITQATTTTNNQLVWSQTVTDAGTATFNLQHKVDNALGTSTVAYAEMAVTVWRP